MSGRIIVVGAGTGGLIVANQVARQLAPAIRRGDVDVILIGDRDEYLYQPGLLYLAFDRMRVSELVRKVTDLIVPGVRFVLDRVTEIDPKSQVVRTKSGQTLGYDYLVLATGSQLNLKEIPGLAEGAHWFYDLEGALRLRDALNRFAGGRLVITVGLPHKCPVAPLEFVFMFDEWARERGIRDKTEIVYTYPINRAHPIPAVGEWAEAEFARRGIVLETMFNLEEVDPDAREVRSLEGSSYRYDLLITIPPHKGDALGAQSQLAGEGNWYPTDRHTLNLAGYENLFVVGDATDLPVPKAGSVAHFQAEVVSENLVNLLTGQSPAYRYHGKTFCFLETGLSTATYITFDYDHPPVVTPPTQAIHWFKQAYNRIHWLNLKGIV